MFQFKSPLAGKVFKKLNHMDKKQAYTYGGIAIVALAALLTLASAAGSGPDDSFDDLQGRGYDLAQMPFVNDEAEQYLLAAKYPDMQNNNSHALYSKQEKEARQEADAVQAAEEAVSEASSPASSSGGYTGYRRSGGSSTPRTPTQIGAFSPSGSMASASGGNTSATFGGSVKGDFSPFQRQDKGKEAPFVDPKNARQALARFNAASRAAARGANKAVDSQKALFGSKVDGTGDFNTNSGVPLLGNGNGLNYEAGETADLSNLDDTVKEKAAEAREKAEEQQLAEEQSLGEMFLQGLMQVGLDLGKQFLGNKFNDWSAAAQRNHYAKKNFGASFSDLSAGKPAPSSWLTEGVMNTDFEKKGYVTYHGDTNSWTISPEGASFFQSQCRSASSGRNFIGDAVLDMSFGNKTNKSEVKK